MTMRTTKGTVTWVQSSRLGEFGEQIPAGHPAETGADLLEGMSFPAYQRTTTMHFMLDPQRARVAEIATDPQPFEEAPTMGGLEPPASNIDLSKVEP